MQCGVRHRQTGQETSARALCVLVLLVCGKRMVELWVSLVRNAACVLKSVLPVEHRVMQPLMSFPFPAFSLLGLGGGSQQRQRLEMFTGLEGLIGLLQLAGACFNLIKGAKVCDTVCSAQFSL